MFRGLKIENNLISTQSLTSVFEFLLNLINIDTLSMSEADIYNKKNAKNIK